MSKKLPRGLTYDNKRERYRVRFQSQHTQKGRQYSEYLAQGTKRREAEAHLGKLREDDRAGRLLWPSERREEAEQPRTFGEFVRDYYLPHAELHNKPTTIRQKKIRLKNSSPWFWDLALDEVGAADLALFVQERSAEGVRSRTVNMELNAVQHVLNYACDLGMRLTGSPKMRKLPVDDARPKRALTVEEVEEILEYCEGKGQPWRALILFLVHTGARITETRNLQWSDLDLEAGVVSFRAETAKNSKARKVPLLPEVVEALAELPRVSEYVWMRQWGGEWRRIPDYGNGGRILWEPPGIEAPPHSFRRTFATWRLQEGVSIVLVSRWLGHSSIQITVDTYGHLIPEDHPEEIARSPRPGIKREEKLRLVNKVGA